MKKTIQLLLSAVLLTSTAYAANDNPPFVNAIQVGNILYLSGQIGSVEPGKPPLVSGGIEAEARQAMENIKKVLEQNGSSMNNVFKCTVMMADMQEWSIMNEIYASYFPNGFPTRSAFGANKLALDARVEIECIATVNEKNRRLG